MKIIFLGAPCSGKGTQAKVLSEKFSVDVISSGLLCRQEIARGTKLGIKLKKIVSLGRLVPNKIINDLVYQCIKGKNSFILDGFPRVVEQALFLEEKQFKIDYVFHINVSREILLKRLLHRNEEREDDSVKIFKIRLDLYEKETIELIRFYLDFDMLKEINGNLDIKQVTAQILKHIGVAH